MNEEAAVVNLFFTVRVFVVGSLLLALPRISRKGLMFGTYVGEEQVEGAGARELMRSWDLGSAAVMVVSLTVGWGISLAGRPIPGNLTGTVVLLVASLALYLWMYGKARRLAPPSAAQQAMRSSASLEVDEPRGHGIAKFALAVCVLGALASAVHATSSYGVMPDRIPALANLLGYGDEMRDKSIVAVLLIPSFNLVFTSFFALTGLLILTECDQGRPGAGPNGGAEHLVGRGRHDRVHSGEFHPCLHASWAGRRAVGDRVGRGPAHRRSR